MILNKTYYQTLWDKFQNVQMLPIDNLGNCVDLSVKMILEHYRNNQSLHINFQNSKNRLFDIGKNLFIELANDIYLKHYDFPKKFEVGDRLKKLTDNKYYEVKGFGEGKYCIAEIRSKKSKTMNSVATSKIGYDKLIKNYVPVDSGISDKTIKGCFDFFEKLNSEKIDFPRLTFDTKVVFIAKKTFWDCIVEKNKIPSIYLPNPRDENHLTETRSIRAFSDCMIYFTPKYEVCYQQLLQKGEKIKTIVIFDTEADKLNQIMQDQVKYKFNVIILSNSYTPIKSALIPCWNWFKEELTIIEALNREILLIKPVIIRPEVDFLIIKTKSLTNLIKKIDEDIVFVRDEFGIELKSYGAMLRVALNAIHTDSFNNILERLEINRELERGLDNAGGYTLEYLQNNNPKEDLKAIINFLKTVRFKENALTTHLQLSQKKEIAIFDNNELDVFREKIQNYRIEFVAYNQLKKIDTNKKILVFHSFNGKKDFDFIYNHANDILLVIYEHEYNLYQQQILLRKNLIETEINSVDRMKICGVKYIEPHYYEFSVSSTIDNIVNRLDDLGNRAYDGYKTECDVLLDDIEEKVFYKITTDKGSFELESFDTLFSKSGDFIKTFKVKIGEQIRIYPKFQLAENLYQVAVETEPELFGKVEEHSKHWQEIINTLKRKYSIEQLHKSLKEKGLRVLPATLESYGKGVRKFPMFNNDLRAIFQLYYSDKTLDEIDLILKPILKSKSTYNSTMIVLGRGLKQELKLFLKEKKVGEILAKRHFDTNTLQTFIEHHMPIHHVLEKTVITEQLETLELDLHFQ